MKIFFCFFFVAGLQQVELLLGCSAGLVQRFNYPWESLSLMYVILKNCRADPEVAIRSITKGKLFDNHYT